MTNIDVWQYAHDFADFMNSNDISGFEDINFVLEKFNAIRIKDGYGLDAFCCGGMKGYFLQPYCYDLSSERFYKPSSKNNGLGDDEYNDKLRIDSLLDFFEAEKIPPVLPYFNVPFTPEGIVEAWLLFNLSNYLPRRWHAYYDLKEYVFNSDDVESLFPKDLSSVPEFNEPFFTKRVELRPQVLTLPQSELYPDISISGDKATVGTTYWNNNIGLVRSTITVERSGSSVEFRLFDMEERIIIENESNIYF